MYYKNLLIFTASLAFLISVSYAIYYFFKQRKIQKLLSKPFPKEYEEILKNIPIYNKLKSADRERIKKSILLFTETKKFQGVKLTVNSEIKVTIAFYACLLLLRIETRNCYDNLLTIIVYPHTVIVQQVKNSGGIYSKEEMLIEGQSANDTLVVAWDDAKKEVFHIGKDNVLIHEFAHEIDFLDGEIDGIPPLPKAKYQEWANVLYSDFEKLREKALQNRYWGKYKILGSYAATNEAEFFAVATERFFGTPKSLKKHFPKLYNELKEFYKFDPANEL